MFNRIEFSNSLQRQSIHPQDSLIGNGESLMSVFDGDDDDETLERIINTKICGKFINRNKIQDVRQQLCDCVISLDRPQQDLTTVSQSWFCMTDEAMTRLSAGVLNDKTISKLHQQDTSTSRLTTSINGNAFIRQDTHKCDLKVHQATRTRLKTIGNCYVCECVISTGLSKTP